MRVISGKYKGRKIQASASARPTTDRLREALFSILPGMLQLESASVLDLYSGSGALGIEALSRGARACIFVDSDKEAITTVDKNLAFLDQVKSADRPLIELVRMDGQSFLRSPHVCPWKLDLVFADPPYDSHPGRDILVLLENSGLLNNKAVVVVESNLKTEIGLNSVSNWLELIDRNYGSSRLRLYRYEQ